MSVQLKNDAQYSFHVSALKDGQLAKIVEWSDYPSAIGAIVQRYKDCLIKIGEESGQSWTELHKLTLLSHPNCRVVTLSKGSLIEVV